MSSRKAVLLRLTSPMQSWATQGEFSHREAGRMPSRSALAGLCCAALGYARGSKEEVLFLGRFKTLSMQTLAVPRHITVKNPAMRIDGFASIYGDADKPERFEKELEPHVIIDKQCISGSVESEQGGQRIERRFVTREYIAEAKFFAILAGDASLIEVIASGLQNPRWGIYLGRKACIPSEPVYGGLYESQALALRGALKEETAVPLGITEEKTQATSHTREVRDVPLSFAKTKRRFTSRRVQERRFC